MNCPRCNAELDFSTGFCFKCGLLGNRTDNTVSSGVPPTTPSEPMPANEPSVEPCSHMDDRSRCETCAAWDSALYNQKRAEQAEQQWKNWEAKYDKCLSELARLKKLVEAQRESLELVRNKAQEHPAFYNDAFNNRDIEELVREGGDICDWTMIAIYADDTLKETEAALREIEKGKKV